jgi:hypothetical protein
MSALQSRSVEYYVFEWKFQQSRYINICEINHVPSATPGAQLEDGACTGRGNLATNTCDNWGLAEHIPMVNHWYVIFEGYGIMGILMGFTGVDRTMIDVRTPDNHLFRAGKGVD